MTPSSARGRSSTVAAPGKPSEENTAWLSSRCSTASSSRCTLPTGDILEGSFKLNKLKLVQAWIEIHQDDLLADWELASAGEAVFKIDPLK